MRIDCKKERCCLESGNQVVSYCMHGEKRPSQRMYADFRGMARILLKGVLNLVSLIRPFLQLVGCSVLSSLATLSAFSLELDIHIFRIILR